jgi:protein-arginine kinase activator protein McsA
MNATLTDFTCPRCGWTHHDFRATGHFRCASCMDAALGPLHADLPSQETTECRGTPARLKADLRIGIQLAVKDENYELAAVLRDTLRSLKSSLSARHP